MGSASKPPKATDPPPTIKLGELVLDRYRVVEQIASGGHSVVFRGQDERLSRPVCIKVFSGLGGQSGVGRTSYEHFVQEAFALSRLTHPNTLRIYDFGYLGSKDKEGMPLQVCEFMNGGTLSQIVRESGRQTIEETVRVIGAMCAALSEAHGLGIVHRDIKPQNILFGTVGGKQLPKLADFGIAKWSADADAEDSGQRAEDTAIVAGQKLAMYSPSWAAPEQLAGQPVSPATDIYSLAAVAIYMLTCRAIFADEDVYAGYKKRRHADELVREALAPLGLPAGVSTLLVRALAFDPKKRISRVDDFATELQALIEPETSDLHAVPTDLTSALRPATATPPSGAPVVTSSARPPVPPPGVGPGIPPAVPSARAPTPPVIPQMAPAWQPPPVARTPWMATSPVATGPARPLPLMDTPQLAGERNVHFVQVGPNGQADLVGPQSTKVRVTLIHSPTGLVIHLKGLTCFVAFLGGRPSPAVTINQPSDLALVTPRAQEIGHIRVAPGVPAAGQLVFALGAERVGVRTDDCIDPILFDFGPGSDAYFAYTRGRTLPRTRTR